MPIKGGDEYRESSLQHSVFAYVWKFPQSFKIKLKIHILTLIIKYNTHVIETHTIPIYACFKILCIKWLSVTLTTGNLKKKTLI